MMAAILSALNARKKHVLLIAQASMSEHQFRAFRALFLDEFGQSGFEAELARILTEQKHGKAGHGQE